MEGPPRAGRASLPVLGAVRLGHLHVWAAGVFAFGILEEEDPNASSEGYGEMTEGSIERPLGFSVSSHWCNARGSSPVRHPRERDAQLLGSEGDAARSRWIVGTSAQALGSSMSAADTAGRWCSTA